MFGQKIDNFIGRMKMLKAGDKIRMTDGSWAFGVKDGEYVELEYCQSKGPFTVVKTGLQVLGNTNNHTSGQFNATADIFITDNDGGFWFVPSRFAKRMPTHTITFDNGSAIVISDESFEALRKDIKIIIQKK